MREFSRTVGAEIEEYDAVALLHARIAADDGRDDKFVRHLLRVRGFDSFLRRRLLHAVSLGDGVIRLLDALPALVAIHGVVAPRDRRDLADADLTAFLFELGEIACRARRRHVAPVEEGMHIDFRESILLRHFEKPVEVLFVAVHAARRNEAEEVKCAARLLRAVDGVEQSLVLEERALGDRLRDARELLVDDAPCADVRMPDLGVAHLPVRQADVLARRLQLGVRIFRREAVQDGRLSDGDGVRRVFRVADSPAVHDDERDRCIFQSCHRSTPFLWSMLQILQEAAP